MINRRRHPILLFVALLLAAPLRAAPDGPDLSPREWGVIAVSRHLLRAIGTPALAQAVRADALRQDAYWRPLIPDAAAFAAIMPDIRKALDEAPYVNGRRPEPDVLAKIVVRAVGPAPMYPISNAGPTERRRILRFAATDLAAFARAMTDDRASAGEAGRAVGAAAARTFGSAALAAGFARFGELAARPDALMELGDARDRLNEDLHPFGLHLVIDDHDLAAGRVTLSGYAILGRHTFNILGKPFTIYEASPAIDGRSTAALGHAETEAGYLFVFDNHVSAETRAGVSFLGGKSVAALWNGSGGEPLSGLTPAAVSSIETAVRSRAKDAASPDAYRALLINTIGRHEGFHMYADPMIMEAARHGRITAGMIGCWHENGAYLYQLEVSDPRFTHLDLLMLLLVALASDGEFPDNATGARAAFSDLQAYLPTVRFWDRVEGKPVASGLAALFALSPAEIQRAASEARWAYEMELRH